MIMTKATGASSRTDAARTADEHLAKRAAQMRERERELRRLVTDYHYAAGQVRKIHADARVRTAKIETDAQARVTATRERADEEASRYEETARNALRAMLDLGEARETVAELTGLSTTQIRTLQHTAPAARTRRDPTMRTTTPTDTGTSTE